MTDDNIISFADYIKRKNKKPHRNNLLNDALEDEIKNRPELMDWYQFQHQYHRHRLFLYNLFAFNHYEKNQNPSAAFFPCFYESHAQDHLRKISDAIAWLDRRAIFLDARGKTLIGIATQLSGTRPTSSYEASVAFQDALLRSNDVIVVSGISESKISPASARSGVVRSLIKTNDDAHFKGIYPESDLLFVDYAGFLQDSWEDIGTYIDIFY